MKKNWILFSLLLSACICWSQDPADIKFGKISPADLSIRQYAVDTGASAVVLSDIGHTQIKGNDKGGVSLEFKRHTRIHILKKNAFDWATVEFRLYKSDDNEEQLKDLKAVTYNLENGKIVETKLSQKTAVFEEVLDRNSRIRKFAFPNVKEGSIIEFEYRLVSDFLFNLQPWHFQREIPTIWTQYTVSMPQFLDYVLIEQGNLPFAIRDQKQRQANYVVESQKEVYAGKMETERLDISSTVTDFRWAQKNTPAFTRDEYISSPANYISRLEFQLAGYLPPFVEKKVMTTWEGLARDLLSRADFGGQLETGTYWMPELLPKLIKTAGSNMEKAQKIYNYIRENFSCTGYNQLFVDRPLDKVIDSKRGAVAELNLLLTCLLRAAGIPADPVILSTRGHGRVNPEYPVFSPFNYVICRANIDGRDWLLDASRPLLPFGILANDCYNGMARVMNQQASIVNLDPTMITESRQTSIFVFNDPGSKWTASVKQQFGLYEAERLRYKMAAGGKAAVEKEIRDLLLTEARMDSLEIDSAAYINAPLQASYLLKDDYPADPVIYISPVMLGRLKGNPFRAADRQYPVEMPFRVRDMYTINIEIPEGYMIDELPKPASLSFGTGNALHFEYNVSRSASAITVNYRYDVNRTEYAPEEYELLRSFYDKMIAKLQEQLVFKKK